MMKKRESKFHHHYIYVVNAIQSIGRKKCLQYFIALSTLTKMLNEGAAKKIFYVEQLFTSIATENNVSFCVCHNNKFNSMPFLLFAYVLWVCVFVHVQSEVSAMLTCQHKNKLNAVNNKHTYNSCTQKISFLFPFEIFNQRHKLFIIKNCFAFMF